MVTMTSSTARSGRTEMIGMGLRAARAAGAVRRGLAGNGLEEADRVELRLLEEALHRSAEAVRYGRSTSSVSRLRHLASVSLAIAAVSRPLPGPPLDPDQVGSALDSLANDVELVAEGNAPHNPDRLVAFMTGLLSLARKETASAGETLKRSES